MTTNPIEKINICHAEGTAKPIITSLTGDTTMKRFALVLLLLSIATIEGAAAERTWTDSTGKFQVEAELVEVQDGSVLLRRADGRTARVPLNRLSKEDQQYVAEYQSRERGETEEELKFAAEAEWGPAFFGPDGDESAGPPLQVSIIMKGKAAAQASAFGALKLETIKDDRGRELDGQMGAMMGGFMQDEDALTAVDRTSQFDRHPKDGLRLVIEIKSPEPPIEAIKELRGSVKLRTGGRYDNVIVDNLSNKLDQPVADEVLKKAGISIEVSKQTSDDPSPESGFTIGFGGEAAETVSVAARGALDTLTRVDVIDARGKPLDPMMSGSGGFGQQMTYTLGFAKPIPDGAKLRLVLHQDAEVITVPLEITDIKVPPVPDQTSGFSIFPGQ